MRKSLQLFLFNGLISATASPQLISMGPPDSYYCDKEPIKPNLFVAEDRTTIRLNLKDASGAPFS
jgi:hypothetical protein